MFLIYNMNQNHYETLGVSKDASQEEIKKNYRKLSLQHHPDRGGNEETFKKLSEAYEQIGDPENRQKYDMEQNNPFLGKKFSTKVVSTIRKGKIFYQKK